MSAGNVSGRRLTVFVAPSVAHAVRRSSTLLEDELAGVVSDALESYLEVLRAGRGGAPRQPTGSDVQLSIPLDAAVQSLLDEIGRTYRDRGTRTDILRAALEAHYTADAGPGAPLVADPPLAPTGTRQERGTRTPPEQSAVSQLTSSLHPPASAPTPRGRPALPDATRKSRRAQARLEALVGSRWMKGSHLTREALQPPDPETVYPLAPGDVRVGVLADAVPVLESLLSRAELDGARVAFPDPKPRAPLDGLTNRVAPTLWGASQLAQGLMEADEPWMDYGDFIAKVIPPAWGIGIGLRQWEDDNRIGRRSFVSSARWPSFPFDASDDIRERREASTVLGFIDHSLVGVRGTQMAGAIGIGPLDSLGLIQMSYTQEPGGLRVSLTPAAISLLAKLDALAVSCRYPHPSAAWDIFSLFLSQQNPVELQRMRDLLRLMRVAPSRADLHREAVRVFKPGVDLQGPELEAAVLQPSLMTAVSGLVARLREWGLASIGQPAHGPSALTPLGEMEATK